MEETEQTTEAEAADKEARRGVSEVFREAWSQALVAVNTAEEEAQKVLGKVAVAAGWDPGEVKNRAREFADKLQTQRQELQKSMEEGVHKAIGRLKVPKREEIDAIKARLSALVERVEALRPGKH